MLIFLVGFMGSGKSFTAKHLSAELGYPYMDMDREIENEFGKSVSEIFEAKGEPWFRARERAVLEEIDEKQDLVVSTGGGAPCFGDNMDLMNSKGLTVFLDIDKETIVKRVMRGIHRRPLLKGMNQFDLEFFYDSKMAERRPFYEKAEFHFKHQDIVVIASLVKALMD